jgi:crossover junction endodeoxyribonuclease RusA
VEITFPLEFLVHGTPVSLQSRNPLSKAEWQERIRAASAEAMPKPHFASTERLAVVLYYLPADEMQGDLDNIIKPILDACTQHVFMDDHQIERIVVQKFEPDRTPNLTSTASPTLQQAWDHNRPLLYVHLTDIIEQEIT